MRRKTPKRDKSILLFCLYYGSLMYINVCINSMHTQFPDKFFYFWKTLTFVIYPSYSLVTERTPNLLIIFAVIYAVVNCIASDSIGTIIGTDDR